MALGGYLENLGGHHKPSLARGLHRGLETLWIHGGPLPGHLEQAPPLLCLWIQCTP